MRIVFFAVVCFVCLAMACDKAGDSNEHGSKSISELLMEQCPIISVCIGESVNNCASDLAKDLAFNYWSPYLRDSLVNRGKCLASATDCETVYACVKDETVWNLVGENSKDFDCIDEEEYRCENNTFIWCIRDEYDTEGTPFAFNLARIRMECNATGTYATDPAHESCDFESKKWSPRYCEGNYMNWGRIGGRSGIVEQRELGDGPEKGIGGRSGIVEQIQSGHLDSARRQLF